MGGWRSSTVSETYIEDSIQNRISIANNLLPSSAVPTELTYNTTCAINLNNYSGSLIGSPELKARITGSTGSGINLTHCNIVRYYGTGNMNMQSQATSMKAFLLFIRNSYIHFTPRDENIFISRERKWHFHID
ncbi:hypothetical protein NQ315_000494 [Exocentrus adspersus]|uniref:Uncharacterized protein n=1 Tax=Exocentrus adspersus TaxID=1586481 RepID=A0AAV8VER0_9CUCU|nr:hypothetical protein NQ315_000494 [Exocentrus adspersus]